MAKPRRPRAGDVWYDLDVEDLVVVEHVGWYYVYISIGDPEGGWCCCPEEFSDPETLVYVGQL
jgi:hypothetical protein